MIILKWGEQSTSREAGWGAYVKPSLGNISASKIREKRKDVKDKSNNQNFPGSFMKNRSLQIPPTWTGPSPKTELKDLWLTQHVILSHKKLWELLI